jgi:signal transduction histidine kinase/BarA-like signal transduction histidine kinase
MQTHKGHPPLARLAASLLTLVWFLSFCTPAAAADADRQTVVVGMFPGEGYAEQDADGHWSGIDIEITENIAQTAGFSVRFLEEDSVEQALADLECGKIDMLADMAKTPEREQNYLFSEYEQGRVSTNVFVREDDSRWDYENTDQLKTMTFSCERDAIAEEDFRSWCSQRGFTPNILRFDSAAQAAQAVTDGKADGYVDGEDFLSGFRSVLSFSPAPYYFIFARDNSQLKLQVDAALGQIYIQDPLYEKELLEKYINLTQNQTVSLSEEEKQYIAGAAAVRVAVLRRDEPYFSGSADAPEGIIPDFYRQIALATGLSFAYQVYDSQADALAAVKNGSADLIGLYSSGMTQAYDNDLILTRKYTTVSTVMITNAGTDTSAIRSIAVKDRSRTPVSQSLPDALKNAALVPCNTAEECFLALDRGQADAVIIGMPSATYLVNQRNSTAYTLTPISSVNLELCAAASQEDHTLVAILNKGICSVAYTMDGIIANNTAAKSTLKTTIARIPAGAIVLFACIMIFLVLLLLWAVFSLQKSRKTRIAAVEAEAAAREEHIKAEASEKSAEEKNAFFATISHDMRTPLNAIVGFIRLAGKEDLSARERSEYLKKAEQSSTLLQNLLDDTLTLSKAGSGKLQLHLEPVRSRELFDPIIVPIREAAEKKHITFTADIQQMRPRTILADKLNVQKIFLNLLSNAIKYTPEGGHVTLRVYLDPAGGAAPDSVLVVSDDGIGISQDFLPKIFEPFAQENRTGYSSVGTGLGLSIVRQLVELMGGTIQVQSAENRGTTFTVRLHFDAAPDAGETLPAAKSGRDLAGANVLLCEDNALNQEIAAALLKDRGISVTIADNGQAGLRAFSASPAHHFDAILMDIRMPVMDGIGAAKAIRALDRTDAKTIPILAMTADAFSDDIEKCRNAGMNGHVAKPIDPEVLFQELSASLEKSGKAGGSRAGQAAAGPSADI